MISCRFTQSRGPGPALPTALLSRGARQLHADAHGRENPGRAANGGGSSSPGNAAPSALLLRSGGAKASSAHARFPNPSSRSLLPRQQRSRGIPSGNPSRREYSLETKCHAGGKAEEEAFSGWVQHSGLHLSCDSTLKMRTWQNLTFTGVICILCALCHIGWLHGKNSAQLLPNYHRIGAAREQQ